MAAAGRNRRFAKVGRRICSQRGWETETMLAAYGNATGRNGSGVGLVELTAWRKGVRKCRT